MKLLSAEQFIYLHISIKKEVLSRYETKQKAVNTFLEKGRIISLLSHSKVSNYTQHRIMNSNIPYYPFNMP